MDSNHHSTISDNGEQSKGNELWSKCLLPALQIHDTKAVHYLMVLSQNSLSQNV